MSEKITSKEVRKHIHQKRQRIKKFFYIGTVFAVLALTAGLFVNAFIKPPLPDAKNVIDISADMSGFDKEEIHVKVGEPVTIRLRSLEHSMHSDGGGKHQWAVDDFKASAVAQPKGTATVTFTPTQAGTFDFYCDICCGGRANPTMNGKLIVEG